MHFQASTPNWHTALLALPDGAVIKAFDGGLLREAKQAWQAAGRDPRRLITVLRHFDVYTAPAGTFAEAKAHWRTMFARWADGTFFEQYAPFVDIVSESNEYTAWSTWQDAAETQKAANNVAAAAEVWNETYRGRLGISPDCRIALLASPVSNGWPKAITQIAVSTDNVLDYHAYCYCPDGQRALDCWRWHSGLWHFIEQEHGLRPRWLFGESGPYRDAQMGWRHPLCLGGDVGKLVSVMRAWWNDLALTDAYHEGRIAGPGCWFTSGHVGWEWYQLETPELVALANAARATWKPGETTVTDAEKALVIFHLKEALKLLDPSALAPAWWDKPTPYTLKAAPNPALKLYAADLTTVSRTLNYTGWLVDVFETKPDGWLRITGGTAPLWLRAQDVTPA